jgi:hypothetical protein
MTENAPSRQESTKQTAQQINSLAREYETKLRETYEQFHIDRNTPYLTAMTFSSSAKPLGHYVSKDELFDVLQERYGSRLESLERHWKLIFRASLAAYQVMREIDQEEGTGVTAAQACIAVAGGDDYNIWDENPLLAQFIEEACEELSSSDIEGLIEALTAQLKG